jgi:hypothetical protein
MLCIAANSPKTSEISTIKHCPLRLHSPIILALIFTSNPLKFHTLKPFLGCNLILENTLLKILISRLISSHLCHLLAVGDLSFIPLNHSYLVSYLRFKDPSLASQNSAFHNLYFGKSKLDHIQKVMFQPIKFQNIMNVQCFLTRTLGKTYDPIFVKQVCPNLVFRIKRRSQSKFGETRKTTEKKNRSK